jgi:hypothetical protein
MSHCDICRKKISAIQIVVIFVIRIADVNAFPMGFQGNIRLSITPSHFGSLSLRAFLAPSVIDTHPLPPSARSLTPSDVPA